MESIDYMVHTLLALYVLATVCWLIWCQLRRREAYSVVVGDSWVMLILALVMAPVICLVINQVHRWQLSQGDEHEHNAI